MTNYLQRMANHLRGAADAAAIPQTEPLDDWQVRNSAGGYSYPVDQWKRLERFLILGSEGGSYYATERTLTRENVDAVKECIKTDGIRTVKAIVDISKVVADQLGHSVDVDLNVYTKTALGLRKQALETFESALRVM